MDFIFFFHGYQHSSGGRKLSCVSSCVASIWTFRCETDNKNNWKCIIMKVVFVHAKLNSGSVSKIFEEEKILIPQSF